MHETPAQEHLLMSLDDSALRVRELAASGVLAATELRRLADLRAVAAFRLEPRPTDPIRQVREGYAAMRARLARMAEHDPARPAIIEIEDGFVYTFRPRTVLRRVLDHALDHLNQIEQWMIWRGEGIAPTATDGWASSGDTLDEDALPLSAADLAAWLWRIDIVWHMLAERAARLCAEELDWRPPGEDWDVRRMLAHVSGGFYTVWFDEGLPEDPVARFNHAARGLRERAQQALTIPIAADQAYTNEQAIGLYTQLAYPTPPSEIISGQIEIEQAALDAALRGAA